MTFDDVPDTVVRSPRMSRNGIILQREWSYVGVESFKLENTGVCTNKRLLVTVSKRGGPSSSLNYKGTHCCL